MHKPTTTDTGGGRGTRRGAAARALHAGERAPDFSLPDQDGSRVSLTALLAKGPVVLAFFNGVSRAETAAQLRALAGFAAPIRDHGGALLAICPAAWAREEALGAIRLLCDARSVVARRYGLVRSPKAGCVPATFVINRDATVVLSLIDAGPGSDIAGTNAVSALAALRRLERGGR
jgi:peroxiredoxin